MSRSQSRRLVDAHLGNVFGALALGVADRVRHATEDAAGQTAAAPAALVMLHEFHPGASVEELRHTIGLTHSGAVRLVDRLVDDGDVERRAAADGRAVSLVLTAKGRRTAIRIRTARAEAVRDSLAPLTAAERTALTRIAEKLLRGVVRERLADREGGDPPPDGWLCRLCDPTACGRGDGDCPTMDAATTYLGLDTA